jgi:putative restriction endonuclease
MIEDQSLNKYLALFRKLRRDYKFGGAPHKPVLLLSVLQLFRNGTLSSNRVPIIPELVSAFKQNWSLLVDTPHDPNFALPFYHLRSEPFWELMPKSGLEIAVTKSRSIRSFRNLKGALEFAVIDQELFRLMNDPHSSAMLEGEMLNQYFPRTQLAYQKNTGNLYWKSLVKQLLEDSPETYLKRLKKLEKELAEPEWEEERFVRGGIFKREVPRLYNYCCSISGMKAESSTNAQLVDACHIIPFAEYGFDDVSNGITLCPNLHRAFDRGLIMIDQEYNVCVSSALSESKTPYSIKQFHGKHIHLPENKNWWPSQDSFKWHRENRFIV